MRFVELRPDLARMSFELHPRITILRGLEPAARVAVVGFLHSVASGDTFDWCGVVEVHGILMSLDRALEIVGETAEAALIVEANRLLDGVDDPRTEAAKAGRAHREAAAARAQIDQAIADLAEELSGAERVRSQMTARLASAAVRIDQGAGRRLDRADGELGRAARRAGRPDPWTGMNNIPGRIVQLEELVAGLDQQLNELPTGDRPILAAAVATARAALSTGPVPCPEAAALAEAWMSLHQRLVGLESRMEATGGGTEAVAARLAAARSIARAAEDAAVPRSVLEEESVRLEELHDHVLRLDSRTGRSIRRGSARKEFEMAKVELAGALEEIGYPTWAAFRMGNGMASVSDETLTAYETSRAELEAAEIEWAELMVRMERDTELQSVLNAIDRALDRAAALLGFDPHDTESDDPELVSEALRAHRVDSSTVPVKVDDALGHLRAVLTDAGAVGHDDLASDVGLMVLGETWQAVLATADEAAVRVLRDRERAGTELKELILLGDGSRVDRLGEQRDAVRTAEVEVAEQREVLTEMTRSRLELHMLAATELAVAEEHDAKLELLEGAKVLERLAEHRLDRTTDGPRGLGSVVPRVPRGQAGAIPLVVLMGDSPIEALDVLLDLPDDVQTIVLGDTPGLSEWAAEQESGTVRCIEVPSFV